MVSHSYLKGNKNSFLFWKKKITPMDEFEKVSCPIHFLVKFFCTTFDFSPPRYRTLNFTVPLFSLSYIILNSFSTQLLYKFSHLRIFRGYIFYFWFSLKWNAKWLPFLNNLFYHGFNSIFTVSIVSIIL